jgi:pimeloyl-ACP methyl ester carboxylesterase
MRERFLTVGGQQYCLCQWGDPSHPPILAFHGLLQQGASWERIASLLVRAGYSVTAPDLRGHGRSARLGRGGVPTIVDFLVDAERALAAIGPRPALLVGHSMGALIAAVATSLWPERVAGVVLVESPLPPDRGNQDPADVLRAIVTTYVETSPHQAFPVLDHAVKWIQEANPGISEDVARMLAERTTEPSGSGFRWTWDPFLRNFKGALVATLREDYLLMLATLPRPALSVYGSRSTVVTEGDREAQGRALRGSRVASVDGTHNLYFEAARALAREIEAFARETLGPGPPARGGDDGVAHGHSHAG